MYLSALFVTVTLLLSLSSSKVRLSVVPLAERIQKRIESPVPNLWSLIWFFCYVRVLKLQFFQVQHILIISASCADQSQPANPAPIIRLYQVTGQQTVSLHNFHNLVHMSFFMPLLAFIFYLSYNLHPGTEQSWPLLALLASMYLLTCVLLTLTCSIPTCLPYPIPPCFECHCPSITFVLQAFFSALTYW